MQMGTRTPVMTSQSGGQRVNSGRGVIENIGTNPLRCADALLRSSGVGTPNIEFSLAYGQNRSIVGRVSQAGRQEYRGPVVGPKQGSGIRDRGSVGRVSSQLPAAAVSHCVTRAYQRPSMFICGSLSQLSVDSSHPGSESGVTRSPVVNLRQIRA